MATSNTGRHILLEVIVSSLDDARAAAAGGADRFEMCLALTVGGLTPSLGLLDLVKRELPLVPVMFMLRPREAGMAYSQSELAVMQRDAELALEHGADGIVFGVLTERGEVDTRACEQLLRLAGQRRNVQTVFHRAFDVVADPGASLKTIIEMGFTRVLTSGRARHAAEGVDEIRRTHERAAGRIEVLPGGGITASNVREIVEATGVDQVHLSLRRAAPDRSIAANPAVRFAPDRTQDELEYSMTDVQAVRTVRQLLDAM